MKINNTSALIQDLAQHLAPTPWYKKPRTIIIFWFTFICCYFPMILKEFFGVSIFNLSTLSFDSLICLGLLCVSIFIGSALVIGQSIPGRNFKAIWWLVGTLFIAWLATVVLCYPLLDSNISRVGYTYDHGDYGCSRYLFLIAVAPAVVLLLCVRALAPTRPRWLATQAMFATGAGGAFCLEFLCHNKSIIHILYGHFGTVLGLGLLGFIAGKRLLKW